MRLEPVFLVAPKPKPPSMPTRRAFLLAGSTFSLGAVLGGACGYSMAKATVDGGAPAEAELAPTNDVELDELRRLAVKAPIEELMEKRLWFVNTISDTYREDEVLWRGVDRLCTEVLANPRVPDRRLFSRFLAQVIEGGPRERTAALRLRCQELRSVK